MAAHHTSAVNLTIFQGAIPVLVLIGMVLFFRRRVLPLQVLGMIVTLLGVVIVSVKGELRVLRTLALNIGDVWMLIACVFYAGYTFGLRHRPPSGARLLHGPRGRGLPVLAASARSRDRARERCNGRPAKGWIVLLYVGLLPSLLSQIFFMRGVELIGPARAGLFVNLVPVFGALLAVVLLGEPFAFYHALGLALVLGGIWLAEQRR